MKNRLFLFTCLLFNCCSNKTIQNKHINDLRNNDLKGNVKLIIETTYHLHDNYHESKKTYYNTYGNILRTTNYNNDGDSTASCSYLYNDSNYALLQTGYNTWSKYTSSYNYNKEKNTVQISDIYDDPLHTLGSCIQKYDNNDNLIESISYSTNSDKDTFRFHLIYKYDQYNNKTEEYYYVQEKLGSKYFYDYDNKGNCIREKRVNAHDSIKSLITYQYLNYDKNGNWLMKLIKPLITDHAEETLEIERRIEYY